VVGVELKSERVKTIFPRDNCSACTHMHDPPPHLIPPVDGENLHNRNGCICMYVGGKYNATATVPVPMKKCLGAGLNPERTNDTAPHL
jgi:hypothetical protein